MSLPTAISLSTVMAFVAGLGSALLAGQVLLSPEPDPYRVAGIASDGVHVHADFLMYLDHERYRFTDDRYQTTSEKALHEHLHLHNNNDHVIHRHAPDQTFGALLESLGYQLNEDCLITDSGKSFCNDEETNQTLQVYVNGTVIENYADYVFADEDQILVYYGNPQDERIETYLSEITDDACIHSGTCPERGTAPPEECGITCEI